MPSSAARLPGKDGEGRRQAARFNVRAVQGLRNGRRQKNGGPGMAYRALPARVVEPLFGPKTRLRQCVCNPACWQGPGRGHLPK